LEGQYGIKRKTCVSLSEQQIVDCSYNLDKGNWGCEGKYSKIFKDTFVTIHSTLGGSMSKAFDYIRTNGGINSNSDYPYISDKSTCKYNPSKSVATNTGYVLTTSGTESTLMEAVANVGPVGVAMDASWPSFQLYRSGIYNEPNCTTNINHAGKFI
jgi:hypothetical protein